MMINWNLIDVEINSIAGLTPPITCRRPPAAARLYSNDVKAISGLFCENLAATVLYRPSTVIVSGAATVWRGL